MLSTLLLLVPFLAGINAANDWTVPCTTGECSYDIPTTNGSSSGTVTIWGSQDAITDITTAADWEILGCDPNALSQDIRLVCKSDDPAAKCSHLYQNIGAVNKLVRLPENCGSSAFARVAKSWVPEDQSIPSSIAARIVRRDGVQPEVKALSLDTNFDAVDWSKTGMVNIAIQGANVPGASGTVQIPPSKRNTRLSQRGLFGFIKNAIKSIATNSIKVDKSIDLKPLDFDKDVNLVNEKIQCGAISAALKIDLNGQAHAAASIGVAATGTIIPPKINEFALISGLTAHVAGTLDIAADVAGKVDSGKINLLSVGIPGLDFPGILTLGPTLKLDAQVTASLDVNLNMTVALNFDVDNAQLRFPAGSGDAPDAKAFSIGDTPLKISASPDVKATGTVSAHLIPSLNLGVSALGNTVKAGVFLALDTSASLKLSLEASADAQTIIDNSKTSSTVAAAKSAVTSPAQNDTATASSAEPSSDAQTSTVATDKSVASPTTQNNATATSVATSVEAPTAIDNSQASTVAEDKVVPIITAQNNATATSVDITNTTSTLVNAASATVSKKMKHHKTKHSGKKHSASSSNNMTQTASSDQTTSTSTAAPEPSTAQELSGRAVTGNFTGCFEVDAGVNVNVGADGSFFGLFDKSAKATLFSKNFVLFKKCFGTAAPKRSLAMLSRLDRMALGRRADLVCPASNVQQPVSVVDETFKSNAIAAA